jgi:hypothetical protein
MGFFLLYILFVLFIMFSHHLLYVSLLPMHFKQYFLLFLQHLKFVPNFQNFPCLPISVLFVLTFYLLCVTFASYNLSVSSSMFV